MATDPHAQCHPKARAPQTGRADKLGAFASTLCAIHCAFCAIAPAAFGVLGLGFLLGEFAEGMFRFAAIAFAAAALWFGWRRHKSNAIAGVLALGICGLLVSQYLESSSEHHHHEPEAAAHHADAHDEHHEEAEHHGEHEAAEAHHDEGATHLAGGAAGVLSGLILVVGHVLNLRASRRCEDCA